MTATLVSLAPPEVRWARPEHSLVIGKDILELLSSSMYVDPMSMYREYIQNSADAIDLARLVGVLHAPGRVQIKIDTQSRTVFIRDNGAGLGKHDFIHQLTALGGSRKRGTDARGFRGVGRLAGLAFAQNLIFRSRQDGEDAVHELRWDAREVRTQLRSSDHSQDLRDIVAKSIETREVPGRGWPERFFEVELKGIIRHRDDRLLSEEQVGNYLAQVAPVPFHPDFRFADQIRSFLEKHGARVGAIEIEILGHGRVFRPHRNSIGMGKSVETEFQELTTLHTSGRDGGVAAVSWILHTEYRGALPARSLVDGWRFRAGDIQIGDNTLLQSLFPEPRFNTWCVAETHVLDRRILPNGRRDHFEQNSFYLDLINSLAPHTREIAQRCRTSSIVRNLVKSVEARITECEQHIRVIEKGALSNGHASKLSAGLAAELDQLHRLSSRPSISPERRILYEQKIAHLQRRVVRLTARGGTRSALDGFTPMQRSILTEVFAAIYSNHADLYKAQSLIDRIVSRLNRKLRSKKRSRRKA